MEIIAEAKSNLEKIIGWVGSRSRLFMLFLGGTGRLIESTIRQILTPPFYISALVRQILEIGVRSFPLVAITALSTGLVMSLQFGYGLRKFGGELYVPKVVALSLVRELGPVFTSLMVAARVGAGIAAEIGSMKVSEQIDAIRALGTSPIKKLVIPRVVAMLISLPLMTAFAIFIGLIGGMIICNTELNLSAHFYYTKVIEALAMKDYLGGLAKTLFFGLAIAIIGCYEGLRTVGGTQGVGISTTRSVVLSSITIVISDFFLSKLILAL